MRKEKHSYPDKILPTVISDMMCYHKHGYSFADFCDRNTHGRNYGRELFPVWEETKARYDADAAVHGNDDHEGHAPRRQSRRRVG